MVLGWIRGGAQQLVNIYTWLGASVVTLGLFKDVMHLLQPWIQKGSMLRLLAIGGTFTLAWVVFMLSSQWILPRLTKILGNALGKVVGVVLGVLRGAFWICVTYFISFALFPVPEQNHVDATIHEYLHGKTTPWILELLTAAESILPQDIRQIPAVHSAFQQIHRQQQDVATFHDGQESEASSKSERASNQNSDHVNSSLQSSAS